MSYSEEVCSSFVISPPAPPDGSSLPNGPPRRLALGVSTRRKSIDLIEEALGGQGTALTSAEVRWLAALFEKHVFESAATEDEYHHSISRKLLEVKQSANSAAPVTASRGHFEGVNSEEPSGSARWVASPADLARPLCVPTIRPRTAAEDGGSGSGSISNESWSLIQKMRYEFQSLLRACHVALETRLAQPGYSLPEREVGMLQKFKRLLFGIIPFLSIRRERVPRHFVPDRLRRLETEIVRVLHIVAGKARSGIIQLDPSAQARIQSLPLTPQTNVAAPPLDGRIDAQGRPLDAAQTLPSQLPQQQQPPQPHHLRILKEQRQRQREQLQRSVSAMVEAGIRKRGRADDDDDKVGIFIPVPVQPQLGNVPAAGKPTKLPRCNVSLRSPISVADAWDALENAETAAGSDITLPRLVQEKAEAQDTVGLLACEVTVGALPAPPSSVGRVVDDTSLAAMRLVKAEAVESGPNSACAASSASTPSFGCEEYIVKAEPMGEADADWPAGVMGDSVAPHLPTSL